MFGERQIQTLLGPADPARDVTVPPAPCSPRELIARAEAAARDSAVAHRAGARRTRPSRRLVLIAAAAAVIAGAGTTAAVALRRDAGTATGTPNGTQLGPVLQPIAYQYETDPPPAASYLRTLAGQLTATPYDGHTGRYAYHDYKDWGGMEATSPEGYTMSYVEERRTWVAPDGSGRIRTTTLPPEFPDAASQRYYQQKLGGRPAVQPGRPYDDVPAGMAGPGQPLTSDRAELAQKLHVDEGGGATAKTIMDKYQAYIVPRAARAQILDILADLPGFVWRGQVTDRAGRAGVAVSFDDPQNDQQSIMIFDAHTGELYAHEIVSMRERRVAVYTLFLRYGYADQLG
ncbi:CU044_5270 family protein [Rugosimonospora africana]|uniref:CU044_5270 family protein n=1 Tax=Rugosimonospora africana TaxID=556532 RepID=A0A8J3QX43_9ACTN|nr:CU044_5270 family protein [Rugosimonospora africana]GIH19035.1 hypothetical protein Raf01_72070 [Rugosimonospora africana]